MHGAKLKELWRTEARNQAKRYYLATGLCWNPEEGYFIVQHSSCVAFRERRGELLEAFLPWKM
jgi:hypothetical protein